MDRSEKRLPPDENDLLLWLITSVPVNYLEKKALQGILVRSMQLRLLFYGGNSVWHVWKYFVAVMVLIINQLQFTRQQSLVIAGWIR